jgi:universal stress protein F
MHDRRIVIHHVLAAVDTSSRVHGVVRAAADLASRFGASITLFRVISVPPEFPAAAANNGGDFLAPKMIAEATRSLKAIAVAENVVAAIRVDVAVEPWRGIVAAADETHADAIVVGSHTYGFLDRIFGTNSANVANHAHCMVVVVHEPVVTGLDVLASDGRRGIAAP